MKYDFDYKKSLGQNFLIDNNIIDKICNSVNATEKDLIIEIGPGAGAITKKLINKNAKIICFEVDKRLEEKLKLIDYDKLDIIFEDFLKVNVNNYIKDIKYDKLIIVGNLPYYITKPIIVKIIKEINFDELIIMVQKEVGERINSNINSREYGSLSVFLQYNADISKVCDVSKNSFEPKPKVDSVVLKLVKNKKYKVSDEEKFYTFIKDSFSLKRKNLKNNLKKYDLDKINGVLKQYNKDLTFRAESLTVEEFVSIFNSLK